MMRGRLIPAGQKITSCEAWVWSFEWHDHETRCACCFRESAKLRSCQGCRLYRYCNENCQRADWKKEHKSECSLLKRIKNYRQETESQHDVNRMVRMMRLACDMQGNTSRIFSTNSIILLKIMNKIFNMSKDTVSESEKQMPAQQILKIFPSVNSITRQKLELVREKLFEGLLEAAFPTAVGGHSLLSDSDIADIIKRIELHNHLIYEYDGDRPLFFGMGLFPDAPSGSMPEACSDQNALVSFDGRTLLLHALDDIPDYSGLQDVLLYDLKDFPFRWPVKERNKIYADRLYGDVECTCRKCSDAYEAIINPLKCATKGCTERIPSDHRALLPCAQCCAVNEVNLRKLQKFLQNHENDFANHLDMWNARDSQAIMVKKFPLWKELEKADILQPEAQLRFVLGWDVARTCSESGRYQEAWELYRDMIVCVRNVSPKYSFYRAQFLREASACVLNWGTEFIGENKEQKKRLLPLLLDAVPLAIELMKDALDTYSTLCKKSVVTGRIASWLLLQEKLQALVLEFSEKSPMQTAK